MGMFWLLCLSFGFVACVAPPAWETFLYGADVSPLGLSVKDDAYLHSFLDLLVHTTYRDLIVAGRTVSAAVEAHVLSARRTLTERRL